MLHASIHSSSRLYSLTICFVPDTENTTITRHVFALRRSQSGAERPTRQLKMTIQSDNHNRDMYNLGLPNCLKRWDGRFGTVANIFPEKLSRDTEA